MAGEVALAPTVGRDPGRQGYRARRVEVGTAAA